MRKYNYQPYPAYQRTANAQEQQQQYNAQFTINRSAHSIHQQQRPYTSLNYSEQIQRQEEDNQQRLLVQQQQDNINFPPPQKLPPLTMSPQLQLPTHAAYQTQQQQQQQTQQKHMLQQAQMLQQQQQQQVAALQNEEQLQVQQQQQQELANAAFAEKFSALQQHQQQNMALSNNVCNNFYSTETTHQQQQYRSVSDYMAYDVHSNNNSSNSSNDCTNNNAQNNSSQQQTSISFENNVNRNNRFENEFQKPHENQLQQQLTQSQLHMHRLQQQQRFQLQQLQSHEQAQCQYSYSNNNNSITKNNGTNNNNNDNANNNNIAKHSSALNNQQHMHLQQLQRVLLEKQQHKFQQQQQHQQKNIRQSQQQQPQIRNTVNNNCNSLPIHTHTTISNNGDNYRNTGVNDRIAINNGSINGSNSGLVNSADEANTDYRFSMDACEIANFLANELLMQQLVSMDGIQSGVPTLTTSTLTPTTLRSIEETFIQLTTDHSNPPCQAGFIPPPVSSIQNSTSPVFTGAIQSFNDIDTDDSQASWTNSQLNEENSMATTDTSSAATDSTSFPNGLNGISNASLATSNTSSKNDFTLLHSAIKAEAGKHTGNILLTTSPNNSNNVHTSNSATTTNNATIAPTPTRRNQGGRRPTKSSNMSPEEEEKRRIRRERNKLAAARCRKRRVDQTNELQTEVDRLEGIRETLQKEVESLKVTKNRLAFILEAHRPTCQKIRQDLLSVHTYDGLIAPTNGNSNDSNSNIIGIDTTLSSVGRSGSPLDLKPLILDIVPHIKNEPLDNALDSNSSLDHDGPPSPKRMLLSDNNPTMIQPPLPNVATLSASLAAASASLNTPIVTVAPVSFANFVNSNNNINNNNNNIIINSNIAVTSAITGILGAPNRPLLFGSNSKQRPNSLPTNPRNQAQNLALNTAERPPTDINGVAIQTPSTGMFNFDSLMDGGTGLTPVSGPLVPTCSSQTNKHPLELQTPTSEPSKLVSL